MNRSWVCAVIGCVAVMCTGVSLAQQEKPAKPPTGGEKPAMPPGMDEAAMEAMMKHMMPGPHHKHLEPLVGKWTYEMKWWMAPDAPAETDTGTAEYKWIMGGRWMLQEVEGPGMMEGTRFNGMGLMGYDSVSEKYVSTWIDDHSTAMMVLHGTCDGAGKVITCTGKVPDAMTGQKDQPTRTVLTMKDKDTVTFEMFSTPAGSKEFKTMELTYKRARS